MVDNILSTMIIASHFSNVNILSKQKRCCLPIAGRNIFFIFLEKS